VVLAVAQQHSCLKTRVRRLRFGECVAALDMCRDHYLWQPKHTHTHTHITDS